MTRTLEVRSGVYVDSVTLMQVSRRVAAVEGVDAALVAMATDLNLDLARGMGFEVPAGVGPNELLVAVDATGDAALAEALRRLDEALHEQRPAPTGFGAPPAALTVRAAARGLDPASAVALVSTPGRHAFSDAVDAVDAGLTTLVFSDNVPVEQEVALKRYAEQDGVLVMGPDCGTAVIGGVGLGFANVVRPGPVGIVAASGTGAQHLMCLLDGAGIGVTHCLGVGGRDLSEAVGGLSTLRALELLDADPDVELVVVVSKPPSPAVAEAVRRRAERLGTPVQLALLGPGRPDLTASAREVARSLGHEWSAPEHWAGAPGRGRPGGFLRGLYSGGTLCDEAMLVAGERLGPIASNIPLDPADALAPGLASRGHTMIDFGDDALTRGRPHPMIDGSLRVERLRAETADPTAGVLLLDVVLGHGADPDPAAGLAGPVQEAVAAGLPVVVCVVGSREDPQDLRRQCGRLTEAGAAVHRSNAAATRAALDLLEPAEEDR
ncbi:FdrA family protein [Nocardioides mesophilus]|uniref:FdrA family protein n=1 Tax=Nocardioides mesophilus TaxID=433659 RepID=A0A7G9RAF2_9ACTN|nr:FdrA family protein [Nocardioides mesophilus]QNN52577.1 FdrA family protein [Nocardioides mesophilus]